MRVFKFFESLLSLRRIRLRTTGLLRFLQCINFNPQNLYAASSSDIEMYRLLISECGFPISRYLYARYAKRLNAVVNFGKHVFMTQDFEDFYHASLLYERRTLDWILRDFRNGGIFVDVGANIGGYTVRLGEVGKVYAFEPHPRNYTYLELNLHLNKLRNVKAYNKAISDRVGKANLYLSSFHGGHTMLGGGEFVQVDAITMDSVLEDEDKIDVIKLDAEGAEILALIGAKQSLKRTKCIVVETSMAHVSNFACNYLHKHGFRYVTKLDSNSIFVKRL